MNPNYDPPPRHSLVELFRSTLLQTPHIQTGPHLLIPPHHWNLQLLLPIVILPCLSQARSMVGLPVFIMTAMTTVFSQIFLLVQYGRLYPNPLEKYCLTTWLLMVKILLPPAVMFLFRVLKILVSIGMFIELLSLIVVS